LPASDGLEQANLVLMRSDESAQLGARWSAVRTFTHGYRGMDARDVLRAARAGRLPDFLQSQRQHITIAVRPSSPAWMSCRPGNDCGIAANSHAAR
jgi:hypothetical protein